MTTSDSPAAARSGTPRALVVAVVAWLLDAALLVGAWIAGSGNSTGEAEGLDTIRSQVGDTAVGLTPSGGPVPPVVLVLLAGVTVLLAAALGLGKGFARYLIVAAGVAGLVLLALAGRWETVPSMLLIVVGTVPLLFPSVHRRLAG